MNKLGLSFVVCLLIIGCADAKINPTINTKAEFAALKAQIRTELKAELTAEFNATFTNKMNTKLNLLGGDVQQKIADNLRAEFQTQIDTKNNGMFSGGGIYLTAVAIALIIGIFGTFMWLVKKMMQWKQIWHILSQTIENETKRGGQAEHVKQSFSAMIDVAGLKNIIDLDLKTRGLHKD